MCDNDLLYCYMNDYVITCLFRNLFFCLKKEEKFIWDILFWDCKEIIIDITVLHKV